VGSLVWCLIGIAGLPRQGGIFDLRITIFDLRIEKFGFHTSENRYAWTENRKLKIENSKPSVFQVTKGGVSTSET